MAPKLTWPGWENVGLIGKGSFGAVYEIQRDVFGSIEKAALKVITIPQSSSDVEDLISDGEQTEVKISRVIKSSGKAREQFHKQKQKQYEKERKAW